MTGAQLLIVHVIDKVSRNRITQKLPQGNVINFDLNKSKSSEYLKNTLFYIKFNQISKGLEANLTKFIGFSLTLCKLCMPITCRLQIVLNQNESSLILSNNCHNMWN